MEYQIVEIESVIGIEKHIIITHDDSFESFPVDESNPRYQQFVLETSGETPK